MAVTGHALNQLLQQMDRTFSNVTGQSVSFIDQEGHYQGPLRLDVFTGFCRRVISSEKGAQHCLACNHSFGLDAEQRCTVSQCHMGISVISVPVPLPLLLPIWEMYFSSSAIACWSVMVRLLSSAQMIVTMFFRFIFAEEMS